MTTPGCTFIRAVRAIRANPHQHSTVQMHVHLHERRIALEALPHRTGEGPEGPANAVACWNELLEAGCPVLSPDLGWGGLFSISGEASQEEWLVNADLSIDLGFEKNAGYDLGVSPKLQKILDKHGLYGEWYNCAVLNVYCKW